MCKEMRCLFLPNELYGVSQFYAHLFTGVSPMIVPTKIHTLELLSTRIKKSKQEKKVINEG